MPMMMPKPLVPIFAIEKVVFTCMKEAKNNTLVTNSSFDYYRGGKQDNKEGLPFVDEADLQDAKLYFIDPNGCPVRLDYQNEIIDFDVEEDEMNEETLLKIPGINEGPQYDKLIESLLPEFKKKKRKLVNLGRWTREEHKKFLTCKFISLLLY